MTCSLDGCETQRAVGGTGDIANRHFDLLRQSVQCTIEASPMRAAVACRSGSKTSLVCCSSNPASLCATRNSLLRSSKLLASAGWPLADGEGAVVPAFISATVPPLQRAERASAQEVDIRELYARCKGNLVRVHEELRADDEGKLSYQALTAYCRRHGIGEEPKKPTGFRADHPLNALPGSRGVEQARFRIGRG